VSKKLWENKQTGRNFLTQSKEGREKQTQNAEFKGYGLQKGLSNCGQST